MTDETKINPLHYQQGRVHCIEYIQDRLGYDGFKHYLLGSHYKYTYRFKYKYKDYPPQERKEKELEDLAKSQWYLTQYQRLLELEIQHHEDEKNRSEVEYDYNDYPSDTEKGFDDE